MNEIVVKESVVNEIVVKEERCKGEYREWEQKSCKGEYHE
ncbi:7823_t:CDS:2 [Racocetra fulgida]|uniref:7823_t:CDS:1 n=1 Tax=Racocetra fulgida TaxID=60492 RepID=A0A9N9BK83_9GLOM|nr:7823_t:CDS:2 [Racocetra fulgida]